MKKFSTIFVTGLLFLFLAIYLFNNPLLGDSPAYFSNTEVAFEDRVNDSISIFGDVADSFSDVLNVSEGTSLASWFSDLFNFFDRIFIFN